MGGIHRHELGAELCPQARLRAAASTVQQPRRALPVVTGAGFATAAVAIFHSATCLGDGALQRGEWVRCGVATSVGDAVQGTPAGHTRLLHDLALLALQ